MSDSSELSDSAPNDAQLVKALRDAVKQTFATGNLENLTVKRIRAAVEQKLDLGEGYFKQGKWKEKSKEIIQSEAATAQDNDEPESTGNGNASVSKSNASVSIPKSPSITQDRPQKKRKIIESIEQDEEDDIGPVKRKARAVITSEDEEEGDVVAKKRDNGHAELVGSTKQQSDSVASKPNTGANGYGSSATTKATTARTEEDLGDSDLSEVFDEAPKPKRKKTSNNKAKAEPKKRGQSKSKDSDPQAEEIKSLQGWLAKCGVRKVWGKELKPYETPREKIKHLKEMLSDIGMTGRYSKEKAESIREARELAADLEAVQEGAKLWGTDGVESDRRKRTRLVRNAVAQSDIMDGDSD